MAPADRANRGDDDDVITLGVESESTGRIEAVVDLAAGGRLAQVRVAGQPLLIDDDESRQKPSHWGAFPQVPWTNRIRHGRFRFLGVDHQLEINHVDHPPGEPEQGHAIHGTVYARRWRLQDRSPTSVTATCAIEADGEGTGWPFPGTAHHRVTLDATSVHFELGVTFDGSDGTAVMPAEVGWHPWFLKPDSLDFQPAAMYAKDATGMFVGELIHPRPGPWDDCFISTAPIALHYDRPVASTIVVSSDCDHWIVFDEPAHATCVEPQSGPPDAVNIRPRVIEPHRPLRRHLTIAWR